MCPRCNRGYEPQPRIRCTPTFFHHPIFGEYGGQCANYSRKRNSQCASTQQCNNNKTRKQCCPTFQRTNQTKNRESGYYNVNQQNQQYHEEFIEQKNVRPSSTSKIPSLQKQISFNPHGSTKFENAGSHNPLSIHKLLWYNPEKQILLRECSSCYHHGLPKERKLVQMSSCPFYTQGTAQRIEGSRCRGCSKLTDCPLCGGYLSCQRCRYESGLPNGCNCNSDKVNLSEVCTCGPCRRCGCGIQQKIQKSNCKCQNGVCNCRLQCDCNENCKCCPKFKPRQKLNSCAKCADNCPCDKNCICSQNCKCCQLKGQNVKSKNNKCAGCECVCSCGPGCVCGPNCSCCSNISSAGCGCGKGRCKCNYNCSCGSNCKCCPKFLPYGTCLCGDGCRCGSNCECQAKCECCPKNKKVVCPKQSYKNYQIQQKFCSCGPQCGCGPECRCVPSCDCQKMKKRYYESGKIPAIQNKAMKSTGINNGTKKTKMVDQNVRKSSQPVFKSLTVQRR